jgi:hypothetical protein
MPSPRPPDSGPPRAAARRGRAWAFRGVVLAALAALVAAAGLWSMTRRPAAAPASAVVARGYRVTAGGQVRKVSTQWAGYALRSGAPHTQVSATWRLPPITCTQANANVSFWVGLGGIRSGNVEQAGVQALCRSGQPVYGSWWQLYPSPAAAVFRVHPGDLIAAQVTNGSGGQVSIDLSDLSTRQHVRITRQTPGAQLTSAEIITEQSGTTVGPLSDFSSVTFSSARIDGHPLNQAGVYSVDMIDASGRLRAIPGTITAGATFTVRAVP